MYISIEVNYEGKPVLGRLSHPCSIHMLDTFSSHQQNLLCGSCGIGSTNSCRKSIMLRSPISVSLSKTRPFLIHHGFDVFCHPVLLICQGVVLLLTFPHQRMFLFASAKRSMEKKTQVSQLGRACHVHFAAELWMDDLWAMKTMKCSLDLLGKIKTPMFFSQLIGGS